ncbi:ERF family protein [Veillonella caviae]|uniref:ERF family protein n=1 Tax=Veillonella caviae TaxID=248316 RepID=UPI00235246D5|nr:ERF family protein [Veillonella caviae]
MEFIEKIIAVQSELKAPKGQYNSFGKYHYRSCEDILEGVKPLLNKYGLVLTIQDEMVVLSDRFYVKATAIITDGKEHIQTSAFARESLDKKGMDSSQVTGATSSYARKYALNGLLCIDDTKDADTMDNSKKQEQQAPQQQQKKLHVKGYDEFIELWKIKEIPPAEITKYIATQFKKPKLELLDEFEMVAAINWIKEQ